MGSIARYLTAPPREYAPGKPLSYDKSKEFGAYHGSRADFDRFNDAFIGSGANAQTFGRGHYLTRSAHAAGEHARGLAARDGGKGVVYDVRVGADPSQMIDYDARLRNQPEAVKAAFMAAYRGMPWHARAYLKAGGGFSPWSRTGHTMQHLIDDYRWRAKSYDEGGKKLTDIFVNAGVPGVRMRSGLRASPNYVIFRDNLLRIVNRWSADKKPPLKGWHGSGVGFDRFDDAYLGSRAGEPAFDYGHYIASDKIDAELYDRGHMYEVAIDADPDHLVRRSEPWHQQTDYVRERLERLGVQPPPRNPFDVQPVSDLIEAALGKNKREVAARLVNEGIPGSALSRRGAIYTIFRDNLLKIIDKHPSWWRHEAQTQTP